MKVVGLAIFICAVLGATSAVIRRIACEHKTMYINCGSSRTIVILRATYGRHSRTTCPSAAIRTTRCHATSSLGIARKACHGKHACKVTATNSVFGDPCRGTFKYLSVVFYCKSNAHSASFSSANLADTREICQNKMSIVNCGQKRIQVLGAFYGRTSKKMCPHRASSNIRCYRNVLSIVKRRCHGKPSCVLKAVNSIFGNPCAGTYKYLVIKYKCA